MKEVHRWSCILFCIFFFSSRRRHTRCYRDWSSDVCSSDLYSFGSYGHKSEEKTVKEETRLGKVESTEASQGCQDGARGGNRSEERRVGKECRSQWAGKHEKKEERKNKE